MKTAYIAHPIGGNVKLNIGRVLEIVRHVNLTEPDVVPFAPYISDCMAMADEIPEERERGFRNNYHYFKSGYVDEIRLYGSHISKGMQEEIIWAEAYNIPVVNLISDQVEHFFSIDYVADAVTQVLGITNEELKGVSRKGEIALARHIFIGLLSEFRENSTSTEIGAYLNRSHSTVLNSRNVCNDLLQTNKQFRQNYRNVSQYLQQVKIPTPTKQNK